MVAYRINNRLVVGLRYSHPYDSTITFGRFGKIARFANNQSVTRVNDISPEFAFSLNKKFSLGFELDIMHLYVQANLNTSPVSIIGVNKGITKNHLSG